MWWRWSFRAEKILENSVPVWYAGYGRDGIMKLTQAVGIIMGANIGTTVTAWILSLESKFFMSLLGLFSFETLFTKNSKKQIGAKSSASGSGSG